jgi:hypothetical protein
MTAAQQTERQFQDAVVEYGRQCGWLVYHPHDSRRSTFGYPDLTMARRGRVVFAELKTETGRLRVEQQRWLDALQPSGTEVGVFLWRPSDWPEIEQVLR